jgi:hypothetical protein
MMVQKTTASARPRSHATNFVIGRILYLGSLGDGDEKEMKGLLSGKQRKLLRRQAYRAYERGV